MKNFAMNLFYLLKFPVHGSTVLDDLNFNLFILWPDFLYKVLSALNLKGNEIMADSRSSLTPLLLINV